VDAAENSYSAKRSVDDRIRGLQTGYWNKEFSFAEPFGLRV
jgi:hypothetical protein